MVIQSIQLHFCCFTFLFVVCNLVTWLACCAIIVFFIQCITVNLYFLASINCTTKTSSVVLYLCFVLSLCMLLAYIWHGWACLLFYVCFDMLYRLSTGWAVQFSSLLSGLHLCFVCVIWVIKFLFLLGVCLLSVNVRFICHALTCFIDPLTREQFNSFWCTYFLHRLSKQRKKQLLIINRVL